MADKELSNEEIDSFKKELADIKADMMRKELEDIKKERMRKELEEIKAERAAIPASPARTVYVQAPAPAISPVNLALSALMLLAAGYLLGTVFGMDVAGTINGYISGLSLPFGGDLIVAAIAIALALLGTAIMTIVRK
ncbi:MAG: hypothetical protein A4E28_00278 [Methanocella sp. PtaU1.Bin125]|nr:MAG: hypothetical protein A4E28_00278 [Methanocella sp. PtaU1.Bin125]